MTIPVRARALSRERPKEIALRQERDFCIAKERLP
jgi:hypothetical protein